MNTPKTITLKTETVNAILSYLDHRPHREVRPLIDVILKESQETQLAQQEPVLTQAAKEAAEKSKE